MGRPDYNQMTQISAITSESIDYLSSAPATPIVSGQSEIVDFYSPAGYVGIVNAVHLAFTAPAGAASGSQEIYMTAQGNGVQICKGVATYAESPAFVNGEFKNCTTEKNPVNSAPGELLKGIMFDANTSFQFNYKNFTNVSQTAARSYRLSYVKRKVT